MMREIKLGQNKISSKSKFEIEAEPNWDSRMGVYSSNNTSFWQR